MFAYFSAWTHFSALMLSKYEVSSFLKDTSSLNTAMPLLQHPLFLKANLVYKLAVISLLLHPKATAFMSLCDRAEAAGRMATVGGTQWELCQSKSKSILFFFFLKRVDQNQQLGLRSRQKALSQPEGRWGETYSLAHSCSARSELLTLLAQRGAACTLSWREICCGLHS